MVNLEYFEKMSSNTLLLRLTILDVLRTVFTEVVELRTSLKWFEIVPKITGFWCKDPIRFGAGVIFTDGLFRIMMKIQS